MAGAPHPNGRQYPPPTLPVLPSSTYTPSVPQDSSESELSRGHGRDIVGSRGRLPAPGKISMSNIHTQQTGHVHSPRLISSATPTRSPVAASLAGEPERRPSGSHGHLRQTSKAHPQARNAIFVTSPATSPAGSDLVSPVNDVAGMPDYNTLVRRGQSQRQPSNSPSGTLHGSSHAASTSTTTSERDQSDTGNGTSTHKRLDRAQSSRTRREHSHQRSLSRNQQQEQKTVGEYALHHLFNKFVVQADYKIKQCLFESPNSGANFEQICGAGADPEFDQLISALAHITRRKPRPLVDTIMLWRRQKGYENAGNEASSPNPLPRGLMRRNTEHSQYSEMGQAGPGYDDANANYLAEQRSAVVVYLTCRVLIEVFNKADITALPAGNQQLYDKLEDIIFGQLEKLEPDLFVSYPFRRANWKIFSQLLGVMSSKSLQSVSRRFTNQLNRFQRELNVKGPVPRDLEGKTELMILAMRHMHVRTQPESLWRESSDFLLSLGELFVNSHGQPIKHAYCQVLVDLLLPIASKWGPQMSTSQTFKDFLNIVNPRLGGMIAKPRHWAEAIPCSIMLMCSSPTDHFAGHWLSIASSLQTKLKDRATRPLALQAMCRLVWTYLDRVTDPPATALRRLDDIMKSVLPSGKKALLSFDAAVSEPIIELIRIIGYWNQEYCFRNIIFPLINSDLFATGKEIKVEQLDPERMVIGIRAFLVIVTDLEKGEHGRPQFPRFRSGGLSIDPITIAGTFHSSQRSTSGAPTPENHDASSSRPVAVAKLGESAKEFHARFCEILGKITIICDNAFGGQAVLDEKFGGFTPKTPLTETFTFGRRDDHQGPTEHRLGFYELLHVAVQALPRCLSSHIQLNSLINLLCTCTAHVQYNIAVSSTHSLKSIARQALAQPVTIGFARFIFNFDARYSTMSEEGLLGPDHIESTLRLYVELLQIWIEEIKQKTKDASTGTVGDGSSGSRGLHLDLTSVSNHVDEVESHGFFFLCSQSRRVRAIAVEVLKIVTQFDTALGRENPRIIQILEGDSQGVMDINDESLTVAERTRLQKGKRSSTAQHALIELSSSDVSYDATLWLKLFPDIIRRSLALCPSAVMLGREIVCARLLQMHDSISLLDPESRGTPMQGYDHGSTRTPNRLQSTSPEVLIEQWKLYLVMACTTVTNAGAQTQSQLDKTQHARKISKPVQQGQDKISSARALFAYVIPLLSAGQSSIRDAIVIALSSIQIGLYRTLLESLQYAVTTCKEEAKQRIGMHQRTGSNPRKSPGTDRLRTEVAQVYRLTARFLLDQKALQDEWIMTNLCTYTKELMLYLSDKEIQMDWECQKLRRHYCGLLEALFNGISQTKDPLRYISFESRKSAFGLMEGWCGFSPNQAQIAQRDDDMKRLAFERHSDNRERTHINAAMETEKRDLSTAALSAMAALCAGPMKVITDRGETLSFNHDRMLQWIDHIFKTQSDKLHTIGRRALHNLIVNNKDIPELLEFAVESCYAPNQPNALQSYFEVVTRVLHEHADYPLPFWRILAAILFTLGSENSEIRIKSAKLLQRLEQRRLQNSKIQDFDISISDRTTAVYKLAQFEISKRLSRQHTEFAFFVFSQFSLHFRNIHVDLQRNMIAAILPWIQVIELQVDPRGGPTAQSYMLLANLLEITTKASGVLHNEIQALWQALATGPHAGNVQLVLDFVISLCLDRRDQSFVYYAKQIIVYLSSTPAGQKVVEFLLLQITPKNMVHSQREPTAIPPDHSGLPYVADLAEALPIVRGQDLFSLTQLSLIFLVDLMVAPMMIKPDSVPLLIQALLVLWDHHIPLVQEQAREMLVHLIHELVVTKIPDEAPAKQAIEAFVESVRQNEPRVVWTYRERVSKFEEWIDQEDAGDGKRVPASMPHVTSQIIELFALIYPNIQDQLAKISLNWGTSCPVRHTACRSLQVFRCVLVPLDRPMLSDILARISNTVVHEAEDVQTFSIEMLTTVKSIVAALEPTQLIQYPHLFWTTCACLDTIFEREFVATLGILENLMAKIDISDPVIVRLLEKAKPTRWQGTFEGVTPLVYKGLKSEHSLRSSLRILETLVALNPNNDLIGNHTRLLFTVLANLPCFLHSFDDSSTRMECMQSAEVLAKAAAEQDVPQVAQVLNAFARGQYQSSSNFLSQILSTIRREYFAPWELRILIFLIGLLTNKLPWYKLKTLDVLKVLIIDVDTRRSEIADYGPDLISPLLRLLSTEYCPQAIEILDHIMYMSETPMSKHHMRMSMAGLGSRSLSVRKEYEKTQSLYGIPEETGWSVPMPAIHSNTTRTNMQLIYQECANPSAPAAEAVPTPEVEFHPEEDHEEASYFTLERSDTLNSQDSAPDHGREGGMSDVLSKLNSCDDFFDETLDADNDAANRYSALTIVPYSPDPDSGADIYDQETAPILQSSLGRTDSISSLHNGFGEQRGYPRMMTPTAFTPPTPAAAQPIRPSLHSRSVTSPANNLTKASNNGNGMLADDQADETFSEDERATGHGGMNGSRLLGSTSLRSAQSSLRMMAPGLEGKEYKQHGLMRAQSRGHGRAPGSPKVPKVPDAYLRDPKHPF